MNGVAREYWNEVFDLRTVEVDPRERRVKSRPKKMRRIRVSGNRSPRVSPQGA